MAKLYVYGTLKLNKKNNSLFKMNYLKSEVIKINACLFLKKNRDYPHLLKNDDLEDIEFDIFEVEDTELSRIDKFEGHPEFFKREKFRDGFIYFYQLGKTENLSQFIKIKSF